MDGRQAQTVVACPECEHPLPADARFCANCGAAAGGEAEGEAAAAESVDDGSPDPGQAPLAEPQPVVADGADDGAA